MDTWLYAYKAVATYLQLDLFIKTSYIHLDYTTYFIYIIDTILLIRHTNYPPRILNNTDDLASTTIRATSNTALPPSTVITTDNLIIQISILKKHENNAR